VWRFDPPAHLGLRRGEEAGQRERAAAALMARGGGAGAGEVARAVGLGCGAEERRRGPFYRREKAVRVWRGAGGGRRAVWTI